MSENNAGSRLVMASPGDVTASAAERTITGLIVPFGQAGVTSMGRLTFAAGSLTWSDPRRVKLLREHDQRDVVGFGVEFVETPAGIVGTFSVPEGDNGDRALVEAANGLRDAFSVGVQLDDATAIKLRRAQGAAVPGRGQLREVSQVSVPAFDDARVGAAASADLVVSSWSTDLATHTPQTANAAGVGHTEGSSMETENNAGEHTAEQTEQTETANAGTGQLATAAQQPAVVPAVAGAALVTSEPSTYTFSGDGTSIVRDLFNSHMRRDSEAAERVDRFNAELAAGNAASVAAFVTAAATRDDVDGSGTDLPSFFQSSPNRPDLMRDLVDVKRPFISRLNRIPISNAQPFAIPAVGEFTGVGPHTEGTPHRPAGTLSLSGDTVQPTATSGAWEVSRELIDATNPALDRIAARAMLRDYRRQSEGKVITLLDTLAADAAAHRYGVDSTLDFRAALLDFVNDDEEGADIAAVSKGMLQVLGLDVDDVNRPQLPYVSPSNAVGTLRAGATGFSIDGVDVFRAARLDAGVAHANVAGSVGVLARSEGIIWAESNVLQFRFDEVLGPGVIKLALWAYSAAAILDTDDVAILNTGVDPTP